MMSLFMLKTHDLTWQDHTVNTEVMLFPVRNQLLMNKHKTLNTKCRNEKLVYEKEKDSVLKNFVIEKRIMERKKQALYRRRSEILLKRVSSETRSDPIQRVSVTKEPEVQVKRGKSAPAKIGWSENFETYDQPSMFITEIPSSAGPRLKSSAFSEEDFKTESLISDTKVAPSDILSTQGRSLSSQVSASSRRVISPFGSKRSSQRVKSVRFGVDDVDGGKEKQEEITLPLNTRIKHFNEAQEVFNHKPPSVFRHRIYRAGSAVYDDPLIAKRYSDLSVDITRLEKSFDRFCIERNKDDFHKLVRMATKMRATANLARNQSLVPSMAAYKGSKAFKDLLRRGDKTVSAHA